jgi:hypothetical protein
MLASTLVLRDVQVPATPPLWPPAPGWWLVIALVAGLLMIVAAGLAWRRLRLRRWQRLFDAASDQPTATLQLAAMSELLRRAARRVDPGADRLQGEAWLRFLDGRQGGFSTGPGRIVLDGGYRRQVDEAVLLQARALARRRFLQLMARRR